MDSADRPWTPERYAEALAGEDPLRSLRKAPKRIRKLVKGMSEKALARPPAPGKWSVKEVLAHILDHEAVMSSRYRHVAATERPALQGYDQNAFIAGLAVEKANTKSLLEDFEALRAANLRLLDRLPPEAFDRLGIHHQRGEEPLSKMVMMCAGHDRAHEAQLERVRTALEESRGKKGRKAEVAEAPATRGESRPERGDRSGKKPKKDKKGKKKKAEVAEPART